MDQQKKSEISNFWYYHKVHMIVALLVVVVLAFTIYDCQNKVEPDISVRGILNTYVSEESRTAFEQALYQSGLVTDLNGDGKQNCLVQFLAVPDEVQSEQDAAVNMQVTLGFAADDAVLYLINEEFLELYEEDGIFGDMSGFIQQYGGSQEDCYVAESGEVIGISLQGNQLLEGCGLPTDTLYMAKRVMRANEEGDEEKESMFAQSMQIAGYLYTQG